MGLPGIDLVRDAVEAGHHAGRERQVRVAGRVGRPELDALGLLRPRVHRDADARGAVPLAVHEVDRRLVARHQPPVGVGRRRDERQQRRRVLQDAADVVEAHLRDVGVAADLVEEVLAVLPERLVGVHAGAVVLEEGLGHEGDGLAVLLGGVLGDVLVPAAPGRPSSSACRTACRSRSARRWPPRGGAPRPGRRPSPGSAPSPSGGPGSGPSAAPGSSPACSAAGSRGRPRVPSAVFQAPASESM